MPKRRSERAPGTARQLDAEHTGALIEAYREGSTVYELGTQFGIDRRTVGKILTRNGVQTKHPGLTDDDIDQAAQLYAGGWSLARIGERLGVTATTVHRRLRERGVAMRAPNGARMSGERRLSSHGDRRGSSLTLWTLWNLVGATEELDGDDDAFTDEMWTYYAHQIARESDAPDSLPDLRQPLGPTDANRGPDRGDA